MLKHSQVVTLGEALHSAACLSFGGALFGPHWLAGVAAVCWVFAAACERSARRAILAAAELEHRESASRYEEEIDRFVKGAMRAKLPPK